MNVLIVCPWHNDTRPSLNVTTENGLFFCHGCGVRGSLTSHPELIPLVEEARGDGGSKLHTLVYTSIIPPLVGMPKEYLLERGYTEEILARFEIGGNQERVWIPVRLRDGSLAGVIFRFILGGENRYRYSYGFRKRNCLFGSKQFEGNDLVYIVEGALDCMRMHQLGLTNTVALLGNQPSTGQLGLLKELGHELVLAFDNDSAGWRSALVTGQKLQERGHTVSILSYDGEDPGELTDTSSFEIIPFLKFLLAVNAGIEIPILTQI